MRSLASIQSYALLKESPSDRAQMLARGNRMPLNEWMCLIAKAPAHEACGPCAALHAAPAAAVSEDSSHFMCDCPAYAELRAGLFDRVREALSGEREFAPARAWFQSPATQNTDRWRWLLGGDMYLLSEAAAKRHGEEYSAAERDLHSILCTPSIRESVSRAVQHAWTLTPPPTPGRELGALGRGVRAPLVIRGGCHRPTQYPRTRAVRANRGATRECEDRALSARTDRAH